MAGHVGPVSEIPVSKIIRATASKELCSLQQSTEFGDHLDIAYDVPIDSARSFAGIQSSVWAAAPTLCTG
jgi:hypothetical protein